MYFGCTDAFNGKPQHPPHILDQVPLFPQGEYCIFTVHPEGCVCALQKNDLCPFGLDTLEGAPPPLLILPWLPDLPPAVTPDLGGGGGSLKTGVEALASSDRLQTPGAADPPPLQRPRRWGLEWADGTNDQQQILRE